MVRTAAGATVNVILNFVFIPRYGAIGSAVATLLSLSCSGFLFNAVHPLTRPIFWLQLRAFLLLPFVRLLFAPDPGAQLANPGSVAR